MFLMWLGEQITERGLGNGISMIIFAGIVGGLASAIGGTLELARTGAMSIPVVLFICALVVAVTAWWCFVERGQRKILVNYAKRQVGNKVYGGQWSHLPLKLNMSGVIPPIFASSIILFPATVASWFGKSREHDLAERYRRPCTRASRLHVFVCVRRLFSSAFSIRRLVFNPKETADNLKKSGAFVPGIRPGEQTARYIDKILMRLTLVGALHHAGVFAAGVSDRAVQSAVLFRRNLVADYCRGDDGFHGAGAGLYDVAPV